MKKYALLAVGILIMACSTNPMTGKKNLILVGNSQLFPMAFQQYQQVLSEQELSTNQQQTQMVKNVGTRIQRAVEQYLNETGHPEFLNGYEWEYSLIENDEMINAWCMPGGKVAFYTGIMPICQNEDGVAVVMGHEITHALAEHSAQQYSNSLIAQGLQVAGNLAINDARYRNTFNMLYPTASQATMLKFSRNHELEADKVGLRIMAMAGYDPREAPKFWRRMEQATAGQQRPPEFFSTHPNPGRRIAQLESLIPEMMPIYYKATGQTPPSDR